MSVKTESRQRMLTSGEVAAELDVWPQTVVNWVRVGVRDVGGRLVVLKGVRVGRRWRFRREWVDEFLEALAAPPGPDPAPPVEPEDRRRERFKREQEEARRMLGRG